MWQISLASYNVELDNQKQTFESNFLITFDYIVLKVIHKRNYIVKDLNQD